MIKAVIFDMFETLVTLFVGRTYFSENIAEDLGVDIKEFKKPWHEIEWDRSTGKYSTEEALEMTMKKLGVYSEESLNKVFNKRHDALMDTFTNISEDSIKLLEGLKERGIKIGLITNTFSDERDLIRDSVLFPYFDVALISYEQGLCKPDLELYRRMAEQLGVKMDECMYVGDGGSKELFAARDAGMHPVQCTWFHDLAFEPHIPCPILDEFEQAAHQTDILKMAENG